MILAIDLEGGIGKDGTLPWYYPEDLKRFKMLTKDDIVVMGRNTWNDPKFPKPLKSRKTVVCSRNSDLLIEPYHIDVILDGKYSDIPNEINWIYNTDVILDASEGDTPKKVNWPDYLEIINHSNKNVWIIGGAKLYHQMLLHVDNVFLTMIFDTHDCDTFFDTSILYDKFEIIGKEHFDDYSFLTYRRNK
jgi:dihydrofolate reductase